MNASKLRTVACASVIATGVAFGLAACSSDDSSSSSSSSSAATTTEEATSSAAVSSSPATRNKLAPVPDETIAGPNYTIADYIAEAGLVETPIHGGDGVGPTINLPFPDGWEDAAENTPDWAYGAIVYNGPETDELQYQPSIIAIVSKLEGNVDAQKIIDSAGGELQNLPGFVPLGDGQVSTLSGFPAYQIAGSYTDEDGAELLSAQKTAVIPGSDGTYVLQINVDGLIEQQAVLEAATMVLETDTTITAN